MVTVLAVSMGISALVSLLMCRVLISAGLQDVPNMARKAHRAPTPTSGGLGIGIGVAAGLIALPFWPLTSWASELAPNSLRELAVATGLAYLFLVIGFIDDAYPLGPRMKLFVFSMGTLAGALAIGPAQDFPIGMGLVLVLPLAVGLIGSAAWIFTLINCTNFMDGANGLAMGTSAVGLAGLAAVSFIAGAPGAGILALCGLGAALGFLVWNYPKGRLFAGDSGALFIGAIAALTSLIAISEADVSPFIPPILFFPILADALLTLWWRLKRRRNLLNGHSEHVYQIAIRAGFSHGHISAIYWAIAAQCAVIGIVASEVGRGSWKPSTPDPGLASALTAAASFTPLVALVVLALIAVKADTAVRRYAVARNIAEI